MATGISPDWLRYNQAGFGLNPWGMGGVLATYYDAVRREVDPTPQLVPNGGEDMGYHMSVPNYQQIATVLAGHGINTAGLSDEQIAQKAYEFLGDQKWWSSPTALSMAQTGVERGNQDQNAALNALAPLIFAGGVGALGMLGGAGAGAAGAGADFGAFGSTAADMAGAGAGASAGGVAPSGMLSSIPGQIEATGALAGTGASTPATLTQMVGQASGAIGATGAATGELIAGVNAVYDFSLGQLVPAVADAAGNLIPATASLLNGIPSSPSIPTTPTAPTTPTTPDTPNTPTTPTAPTTPTTPTTPVTPTPPAVPSGMLPQIAAALGLNATDTARLLAGGVSALGGLLSGNAAQDAAQRSADAQIAAARIAADAAKFRPVGVTTRFGQSNFGYDANGNLTSAGYTVSPELRAMQNSLLGAAPGMLTQFTGSQATTAPMGTAAQRAMTLGNQYLATDPVAQAKKYYDDQQAVMAAQRARDQAGMLAGEFNRGTYGLATGGTGTMGAANPRLEALYNAQRQQDLQLAANATQGGMDYAKFGTGMVGAGGDLLKSMYGTQVAAYDPYKTALGGAQAIEGLGQNALDLSINMGKTASPAQSGQLLAQGMLGAAQTMQPANSYSPWGSLLSGAGNSMQNWQDQQYAQQQQQQLLNAINWSR